MFRQPTPSDPPASADHPPAMGDASMTETAPCQKAVRVHVKQEAIAPVRSAVLGEFRREATLPGFRKGKAPVALVERQYAKAIQDETLQRVTREAFEQAARTHHLKPVGPFELSRADFSDADGLTLEATVEVEPTFTLGDYASIRMVTPAIAVSPQDIEQGLEQLRQSMAQLVPAKEGAEKERQVPALDDELAKDLGFPTLDALRQHVEAKLREQQRAAQAQELEATLCAELLKRQTIDVPPRLVSRQTERLTRDFQARLLLRGMAEDKVQEELAKFTDRLRTSAEQQVKLGFILDRVADQESIKVQEAELVERLWQLSQRWKKDPAQVRAIFDSQGLWPSVISAIRQEKTIARLLTRAIADPLVGTAPTGVGPVPGPTASMTAVRSS